MKKIKIKHIRQLYSTSCGAACLQMICKYYGSDEDQDFIFDNIKLVRAKVGGFYTTTDKIVENINNKGFSVMWGKLVLDKTKLLRSIKSFIDSSNPIIACIQWSKDKNLGHYILINGYVNEDIYYLDPEAKKIKKMTITKLLDIWRATGSEVTGGVFIHMVRSSEALNIKNIHLKAFFGPKIKSFILEKVTIS